MVTESKIIACLSLFFLIFAIIPGSSATNEILVNPGESIQDAVDNASGGDIITVNPGIYYEYVLIEEDNLTLRSEAGPENTIIFGTTASNDVIQVIASNVTVSGFSIDINATTRAEVNWDTHGICLNSNINNCTIENNNVTNQNIGINLCDASDFTVKNNEVSNNEKGIRLSKAYNNVITQNFVRSNTDSGIKLETSENNLIYNNYFNNTNNANDNKANTWNTTIGNYWSDYEGTEFDENGIGVIPYEINPQKKSIDYRPLMNFVFEPPVQPQPDADFKADEYEGPAPLTINFTDLSKNATDWYWDFGDGNQSNVQNPTHIYTVPGSYNVTLTVFNGSLSDSKEILNCITVNAAGSGGGDAPDTNPPVTYDDASAEWRSSSFTVTFTVEDMDWNATFYQVDGGEWKVGNSVEIIEDGIHTITYYSDDLAGNAELPKTAYAKLDTSAPITTDNAPAELQNSSFTVTLDPVDLALNSTFYRVDGGAWKIGNSIAITEDGNHIIAYYSDDLAGNAESPKTTYAKLDTTAPVTTDNAPAEWQSSSFTVMLVVQDLNWNATFYQVDGGEWKIGNSIEITEDGNHSISYYSDDLAGNAESSKTTYAKLDTTAPVTTDNAPAEWQSSSFTVMLVVQDLNWNATFYQVDGGEWKIGNSVEITEDGNHSISYYSDDLAGNVEGPKTVYAKLDTSSPGQVSNSHHSGGNGVGSAKIIRKEKLEPVGESDLASGSNSPGENSEKSDEYKALKVQSDMANHVAASGSEEEDGGQIPGFVLPFAAIGLVSAVYVVNRGKKNK